MMLMISYSNVLSMWKNPKKAPCRTFSKELSELAIKREELTILKSVVAFLAEPVINNHNFTYITNPHNACAGQPELLFAVPSAPRNFMRRKQVRQGFLGTFAGSSNGKAKLLFFVGRPYVDDVIDTDAQASLEDEIIKNGDIVQEDYEDSFRNLRFKAVSILKWPSTYCKDAKYVIRANDDVEFSIHKLLDSLKYNSATFANFVLGHKKENGAPVRADSDRMYISKEEFSERMFPVYVCGWVQAYPLTTVRLLYQAAQRVQAIWLEDVYITGMCAWKVDVALVNWTDHEFKHVQG